MRGLVATLDRLADLTGRAVGGLALLLVIVTVSVVLLRYRFDIGSIALQESVQWLHALLFMLGIAYTYKSGGHVRVDILYGRLSARGRAWIDLIGTMFLLLPLCIYLLWVGFDEVAASWREQETSRDAGGLEQVWLLKSVLLAMPLLLFLQGIAEFGRALITLRLPAEPRQPVP